MNRRDFLALAPAALLYAQMERLRAAQPPYASGLRSIADGKSFRFGSAIDPENIDDPIASELYLQNVNSVTPRNQLKWTATQKRSGVFTFEGADKIVAFAREYRMKVYGHTLIWYHVPRWVSEINDAKTIQTTMERHIKQLMTRYKGTIDAWDVVNEPLEYDTPNFRSSVFSNLLGNDYIRISFEIAREADPSATLVLNETHLEKAGDVFDKKRTVFLNFIEKLVAQKVPINAVGLQSHFRPGLDRIDAEATARFCKSLKDMGVSVFITELDASCRFVERAKGFTPASYAEIFCDMISAAGAGGDLKGVTVWGLAEKYAQPETKVSNPQAVCNKRINLFDENNIQRSSVDGIKRALEAL